MSKAPPLPTTTATAATPGPGDRGRSSPAEIVARSGLPAELQNAVLAVTGKLRLTARERTDVARELCAHFRDGLETGETPADMLVNFGDPETTARLIRRAKKRQRGPAYQTLRRMAQGVGALAAVVVLTYVVLAVRFFAASPEVSVDYLAKLNEATLSTPEEERAWPGIRAAILAAPRSPYEPIAEVYSFPFVPAGTPDWDKSLTVLPVMERALGHYTRATGKPVFGRVLQRMSELDPELAAHLRIDTKPGDGDIPESMLIGVLLPELGQIRGFARLLAFDARVGAHEGDGARTVRALKALFDTTRLTRQQPFLISDLVGQAVLALGVKTLADVLATHPDVLSDEQLTEVAHTLAVAANNMGSIEGAPITPQLAGERVFFLDAVQHVYTDDGYGDGRVTAEGMKALSMVVDFAGDQRSGSSIAEHAIGPVLAAAAPGRMEAVQEYEQMMAWTLDKAAKPMWLWTDADSVDLEVERRKRDSLAGALDVSALLIPALDKYVHSCNLSAMQREAGLAMIAIELHKRRTGALPGSLEELGRKLLPIRPIDRYTGGLMGYKLDASVASGYRLYSTGSDYADDGGKLFRDSNQPTGWRSRSWVERARKEYPQLATGAPLPERAYEHAFIGLDMVYMPPADLLPESPKPPAQEPGTGAAGPVESGPGSADSDSPLPALPAES